MTRGSIRNIEIAVEYVITHNTTFSHLGAQTLRWTTHTVTARNCFSGGSEEGAQVVKHGGIRGHPGEGRAIIGTEGLAILWSIYTWDSVHDQTRIPGHVGLKT